MMWVDVLLCDRLLRCNYAANALADCACCIKEAYPLWGTEQRMEHNVLWDNQDPWHARAVRAVVRVSFAALASLQTTCLGLTRQANHTD